MSALAGSVLAGMGSVLSATQPEEGTGAGITQITSTGGSVTVTNPLGPIVNLEVAAAPAALPTGRVGVGVAGVLGSFSSLTYSPAGGLVLQGNGSPFAPQIILNAPTSGGLATAEFDWHIDGTLVVGDVVLAGAFPPSQQRTMYSTDPGAEFIWNRSSDFQAAGQIFPTTFDAGFGNTGLIDPAATGGFFWIPRISGPPSGVPAKLANFIQMVPVCLQDGATPRLWSYSRFGAAWKSTLLT